MIIRKIKKWYFKIYHLFKLIGIFILFLIPYKVYAEEYNECFDTYKIGNITLANVSGDSSVRYIFPQLPVEANKTYYIRFFSTTTPTCSSNICFNNNPSYYGDNSFVGDLATEISWDNNNQVLTLKVPNNENIKYVRLKVRQNLRSYISGTPYIASNQLNNVLTCNSPQPNDDPITEFTEIYTDRLEYLGTESMNNNYMLAFIGVIIGFIVLEIFLRIFHIRGGYKK